jgi:molybdate transport system substrate-binding protein
MNTRARTALLAACIPALTLLPAQNVAAQDTEIRIFCSNGFRAAMEKLRPEYERAIGRKTNVQFGASANFKRSIEAGEPFDLAILTPQIVEDLIKEGKMAAGTAVDLASTGIGVAVRAGAPKPSVSTAQTMKQTLLKAKSIGYVKVGAGTPPVVNMLNQLGISEDVQRKTVFQSGAEESMASIAEGKTDIAFALISEILAVPGVQLAGPLPPEFQKPIIMADGISSSTKNREAANQFVKSLTGAAAAKSIKAAGMDPIGKEK